MKWLPFKCKYRHLSDTDFKIKLVKAKVRFYSKINISNYKIHFNLEGKYFNATYKCIFIKICVYINTFKSLKLLFLGDSTNRGVMHTILEKLSGNLHKIEKIHAFKQFKNIQESGTDVGFMYYPRFWMQNISFETSLEESISRYED